MDLRAERRRRARRRRLLFAAGAMVLGAALASWTLIPGWAPAKLSTSSAPAWRGPGSALAARARLRVTERRYGSSSAETAEAALRLADALQAGSPDGLPEARREAERAVAILESLRGPDHPDVARSLEVLAQVLWISGDFASERPAVERALAIRESESPAVESLVLRDLHYLADLKRVEGDYGGAVHLRARSGPILERLYGPDHPEMAVHFHALAILEEATDDLAAAIDHAGRAVRIRAKAAGPADPVLASELNLLGSFLIEAGDPDRAQPIVQRALAISESSLGPDHLDVARALSNLAALLSARGDHAQARPPTVRALSIREKALGPNHLLVARNLSALGAIERRLGRPAEAEGLLRRAIAIQETGSIATRPDLAASTMELALLDWGRGEARSALDLALRAEGISRGDFTMTAGGLSEREALGRARMRGMGLHLALAAAAALDDRGVLGEEAAYEVFDEWIRSRALVLDVLAARHRILSLDPDELTASLVRRLDAARGRLARLVLEWGTQDPSAAHVDLLRKARDEAEGYERALAERSLEFRSETARENTGLAEVAKALPPGSALISYARYEEPSPGTASARSAGESRYLAFVMRADGAAPRVVPLGPPAGIDARVEAWEREIGADPRLARAAAAETSYRRVAARLGEVIWEPVAGDLTGTSLVFVVPDGALFRVNLAALPARDGAYLAEARPSIHYLAAEKDVARTIGRAVASRGLLAIGNPDYDHATGGGEARVRPAGSVPCGGRASLRFDPLPGSGREASDAASRWAPPGDSLLLTGREADEGAFKRLAPTFRVLHLGTHAFFSEGACDAAPAESDRPAPGGPAVNPLRLSGLAFAGANLRDPPAAAEHDDGILTSEEIALLDLRNVEWAVLSACSTGRGDVAAGEGVLGLQRAFQVAGARTLIMSLWPIEDDATRHWMRRLYDERRRGATTAESVRRAALGIIESQRRLGVTTHPYFWASFVAVGDWR